MINNSFRQFLPPMPVVPQEGRYLFDTRPDLSRRIQLLMDEHADVSRVIKLATDTEQIKQAAADKVAQMVHREAQVDAPVLPAYDSRASQEAAREYVIRSLDNQNVVSPETASDQTESSPGSVIAFPMTPEREARLEAARSNLDEVA